MVYKPEGKQTPELWQAYEELTAAIKKVISLNNWNVSAMPEDEQAPMMLGDYLVLAVQQGYDKEGDGISSLSMIAPHGQLPWHRMIGIIHEARIRVEHQYNQGDDDD